MPRGSKGFQPGQLNPSTDPKRREQIRQEKSGKKLSEATKRKLSASMREVLKDPEKRKKWSEVKIGHSPSEETRQKISRGHAKKPKSVTTLKNKADKVFAQYIRLRDSELTGDNRGGCCITCKQWVELGFSGQAGHFISRRFNATRFDEQNVNLQCARCNMWGGGEQYQYSLALDEKYGEGTAKALYEKSLELKQWKTWELEEMIETYKEKLVALDRP